MRVGPLLFLQFVASLVGTAFLADDDKPKPKLEPPTIVIEVPAPMPAKWQEFDAKTPSIKLRTGDDKPADWTLVEDTYGQLLVDSGEKSAAFVPNDPTVARNFHVILKSKGAPDAPFGRIRIKVAGGTVDPFPPVPPDPSPIPIPPDPPEPVATVKSFVIVEDTLQAGSWRGDILGSTKITAVYKAKGMTHRLLDKNLAPTEVDDYGRKYLKDANTRVAAGAVLPLLWTMDAAGKTISDGIPCPKTEEGFLIAIGGSDLPRAMGALRVDKLKYAWRVFGENPHVPLIPKASWKEVDYSVFLPPVYDQDGRGQCASSATCTLIETSFRMAGLACPKLSAGDLYSRVNGGRDQGSTLEDNLYEAMVNGVATAARVSYVWDGRVHNDAATVAERKKYRIAECYLCETFEAMSSAAQQGFVVNEALDWYNNFNPGSDGWLPTRGVGYGGGHSLSMAGTRKHPSGYWGALTRNSWSSGWGVNGNCIIPEQLFSGGYGGYWAIRAVNQAAAGASGIPEKYATPKMLKQAVAQPGDGVPVVKP